MSAQVYLARQAAKRFHAWCAIRQAKRADRKAGLVVNGCPFLLAPTRRCQAGKTEAEQSERTGFRDT